MQQSFLQRRWSLPRSRSIGQSTLQLSVRNPPSTPRCWIDHRRKVFSRLTQRSPKAFDVVRQALIKVVDGDDRHDALQSALNGDCRLGDLGGDAEGLQVGRPLMEARKKFAALRSAVSVEQ